MEWTATRIQLHALRRRLCRMLDQCEPCEPPDERECLKCAHGNRMRELMKEIEATQKRDREERRAKKPVHAEDAGDALPAEEHKPVRFSANYATFDI